MFRPQQAKTPYRPYKIQMTIGEADFGVTSDLYMYDPDDRVDKRHSATATAEEVSYNDNSEISYY